MNPKGFFGELKRRNVYKVAVAYAVVSWLLIQVRSGEIIGAGMDVLNELRPGLDEKLYERAST